MKVSIYKCGDVIYVTPFGDKRCLPNGGIDCDILHPNVELKNISVYGQWANKITVPEIIKTLEAGKCWNNSGTNKVSMTGFNPQ